MSVALNVIIILGIVIAGGFFLFFAGDFLFALIEKNQNGEKVDSSRPVQFEREEKKEAVVNSAVVQAYVPEEANAEEGNTSEEDEEEKRIAEARAALEKRKEEILKRMQAQIEEDDEEKEDEDVAEEAPEEDAGLVTTEEAVAEEDVEEPEEEKVDTDALQAEIERLKNELGVEREKYDALAKELENKEPVTKVVTVKSNVLGSKEDYEQKLVDKVAELKVIEKEFKQCKKDFIPLYRVNKTLEKDEKKLARKEAIVAKQKVVLYGVNNYADIDEEKAKKLTEDLDLLDGLKLSVNHCREVMETNKDRYPILEKLYNTLKAQLEGLKTEIAQIEEIIANFDNDEQEVAE